MNERIRELAERLGLVLLTSEMPLTLMRTTLTMSLLG